MDITLSYNGSEKELIAACRQRKRWAQKLLYESYYSPMMAICLRYASSRKEAEDTLHEAFIKVFNHIDQYQAGTSLTAWIRRIVVNACIDQFRKSKRRRTEDLTSIPDVSVDHPGAVSKATEEEILKCIQELPATFRQVFNLYVMDGFSHREVGEIMGIKESTSRSNLVKARSKLRAMLRKKGIYNE